MADTKLVDMTDGSTAEATDIIYAVRDPSGTPANRKLSLANVLAYIAAQIEARANSFTAAQTITPLTDAAALTVRRNSDAQTAKVFQVQTEANAALATIDKTGALESSSLKTAAPTGGTSGTWKLGVRVAATTALDTTQYVEVDIGGTLYKLAVVTVGE